MVATETPSQIVYSTPDSGSLARPGDEEIGGGKRGALVASLVPLAGGLTGGVEGSLPPPLRLQGAPCHHHRPELAHEVVGHLVDAAVVALVQRALLAADVEGTVEQLSHAVLGSPAHRRSLERRRRVHEAGDRPEHLA